MNLSQTCFSPQISRFILFSLFHYIIVVLLWYLQKFLKMYHSWIQSLHHSPLCFIPHSWDSFNMSHSSIFIYYEHKILLLHLASFTLSLCPPLPTGNNYQTGCVLPSCSLFLKKSIFLVNFSLYRVFSCAFPCIITWIGSCPPFSSFLLLVPCYGHFYKSLYYYSCFIT
jgi:hypothetical protein